jgi:glycerophosphoryl diester phosphodiesterase
MHILAHRGRWDERHGRNSLAALNFALNRGYGLETDIRDHDGFLVISHDPPCMPLTGNLTPLSLLAEHFALANRNVPVALNVKADGLQEMLANAARRFPAFYSNVFFFDMSVPDALGYLKKGFSVFTRQSEYEKEPSFLNEASGVWMDCFFSDWIMTADILRHTGEGRKVALVSPELHGRDTECAWEEWKKAQRILREEGEEDLLMICTDFPDRAEAYFA